MTSPYRSIDSESNPGDPARWLADHGDALFRYAMIRVRREDVAEDVVQDTLLSAWSARATFRQGSPVRTWLIAILKRKIIDWLRKTVRERATESLPVDDWLDGQFTALGKWKNPPRTRTRHAPEAVLERAEFEGLLQRCLDKVPDRLRRVFVLWHLDERNRESVCQELNISATNLWVMLHRTRTRLWRCLQRDWFGEPTEEKS